MVDIILVASLGNYQFRKQMPRQYFSLYNMNNSNIDMIVVLIFLSLSPPSLINRFSLMGWCWALTPSDRPRFSHLTIRLKEFYDQLGSFI